MRFLFFFLFLSSCGYHLDKVAEPLSIDVPYIEGDKDGLLTHELIYQMSNNGFFEYHKNSNYVLQVNILDIVNDQIGYRKDRDPDGNLRKNLVATENRLTISAQVTLVSTLDNSVLYGPKIFTAFEDFDYVDQDTIDDLSFIDKQGNRETVLAFSLGQMESIGCAQDVALKPLYKKLSLAIVSAIRAEYHFD